MSTKSWTYAQVTRSVEETISKIMDGPGDELLRRIEARAAYWCWYRLTVGWQKDGDNERLEALAEGK